MTYADGIHEEANRMAALTLIICIPAIIAAAEYAGRWWP